MTAEHDLLARTESIAQQCAAVATDDQIFPHTEFAWLADAGLLTAPLPVSEGGFGLGIENGSTLLLLRVLALVGYGNLSVGRIYEGHVNALQLIHLYGTADQKKCAAIDARNGKIFGVWNSEAADGVHIDSSGPASFRLRGSKTFASGAGGIQRAIVPGVLEDGGWQMCLVPMDQVRSQIDPSWWQPIGMRASVSFKVDFTGIALSANDLIGQANWYTRQPYFSGGAIRFAAVQLGGAQALFDAMRRYVRESGRLDDPYQIARAGEIAILLEGGRMWLQGAARRYDGSSFYGMADVALEIVAFANAMRLAIERACLDVIELVTRSVSARGLLRPHPTERILRDLMMYLRQPAPDAAMAHVGNFLLKSDVPAYQAFERSSP